MALADFLAENGLCLSLRLLDSASTLTDPQGNRAIIWSFGQLATTPASQSAWVASPGPPFDSGGSGRSLTAAIERPMAFKWTKVSRAKLSRSQKARWKERKRQQRRKRAKRSR